MGGCAIAVTYTGIIIRVKLAVGGLTSFLYTLKQTCVKERLPWVNVDSPIIHIQILVFSTDGQIKVLSLMHIHDSWLYLSLMHIHDSWLYLSLMHMHDSWLYLDMHCRVRFYNEFWVDRKCQVSKLMLSQVKIRIS